MVETSVAPVRRESVSSGVRHEKPPLDKDGGMHTDRLDNGDHVGHNGRQGVQLWQSGGVAERGQGQDVEATEEVAEELALSDSLADGRCGEDRAGQGQKSDQRGLHFDY